MRNMRILTTVCLVLALTSLAGASGFVNGSFENGLTGWTTSTTGFGAVTATTGYESWFATNGTYFALLATDATPTGGGSTNPQTLYQTVMLTADQQVEFDYFFDQDSLINRDTGWATLGGTTLFSVISNVSTHGQWVHFISGAVSTSGAYTLEFGVNDADGVVQSHLGVDNVRVVPEPLTMLAALGGIITLGAYLRQRRV